MKLQIPTTGMSGTLVLISAASAAILPVLLSPYPPIQDLPAHAAMIRSFEQIVSGSSSGGIWVAASPFNHSWLPYAAGALLCPLVGAWWAAILLFMVAVAGFPVAVARLARVLESDEGVALTVGVAISWTNLTVLGFLPFHLGLTAALACTAVSLKSRGPAILAVTAFASAILLWYLHFMAWIAYAGALLVFRPGKGAARLASLSALIPAAVLFKLSGAGSTGIVTGWTHFDPSTQAAALALFLGPASRAMLPDLIPATSILLAVLLHIRGRRTASAYVKASGIAVGVFAFAAIFVPDFLDQPRIIHPVFRFAPFAAAMMAASVPRNAPGLVDRDGNPTARFRIAFLCLAAASIGWTSFLTVAEGTALRPEADAIKSLPAEGNLLGATLHRPRPGGYLTTYDRIHMPFLYQAVGSGDVLSPFAHSDTPLRLAPGPAADCLLHGLDIRKYVISGRRWADRVLTDGGDIPEFMEISTIGSRAACGPVANDWRCAFLSAHDDGVSRPAENRQQKGDSDR